MKRGTQHWSPVENKQGNLQIFKHFEPEYSCSHLDPHSVLGYPVPYGTMVGQHGITMWCIVCGIAALFTLVIFYVTRNSQTADQVSSTCWLNK